MPLAHPNGSASHRRTLSSKSLAKSANTSKITSSSRNQSHPKLTALGKKRNTEIKLTGNKSVASVGGKENDIDHDMTFHQYCTMCDKQILVPNSQVLYCSESCRRKDSVDKPQIELKLAMRRASVLTSPTSPLSMSFNTNPFDDNGKEQSRLSPTTTSTSLESCDTKPPELHSFKPDLDPTEWKPNSIKPIVLPTPVSAATPLSFVIPNLLPEGALEEDDLENGSSETTVPESKHAIKNKEEGSAEHPCLERKQSAAFSYLAQFHRSTTSFLSFASNKRPSSSLRSRGSTSSYNHSAVSMPALETSAMSLGASSRTSSTGDLQSEMSSEYASDGLATPEYVTSSNGLEMRVGRVRSGSGTEVDGGLVFGKKIVGMDGAEGSLRELLGRA